MSLIQDLIAGAEVQGLVIVVVKIVGDTGLGDGQAGENGPFA